MGAFALNFTRLRKKPVFITILGMTAVVLRPRTPLYIFALAVLVAIFAAPAIRAEDPAPPAPSESTRKSGQLGTPKELAQWQLDIAESSYALSKTDRNLTSLLSAYERLMALYCMPNLSQTLQYKGFPTDPLCLKYLDAAFALDAENPFSTCSRDGIDSRSCEEAFNAQETVAFSSTFPIWPAEEGGSTDLDLALDTRSIASPELNALNQELSNLEGRSNISPELKAELMPKLRQVLAQTLGLTCKTVKLKVQTLFGEAGAVARSDVPIAALKDPKFRSYLQTLPPSQREEAVAKARQAEESANRRPGQEPDSPMDEIVKGLSPTPVAKTRVARIRSDGVMRTRFISPQCEALITRALRIDPGNASATCARYGDYTPDCIKARRRERAAAARQLAPRKDSGTPEPKSGQPKNFSTF